MAKIDEKYVEALNNYSKSLEKVVEILQQQVKSKDTDVLETMLKNMDGEKLKKIVNDLNEVKETGKRIESKVDKISKQLQELKTQRDSFGQIVDPKNKHKIIDGIKVITLIAGGVLAIGMAFKLIGHVDILSVIALGISISLIAVAFEYVNEKIKKPDIKRTMLISGMLVIVATAMTVSSWVLAMAKPISLLKALSIGFTALAVGGALYIMTQALEKTNLTGKTILKMFLLPFLAPIISMAIVTSSNILSKSKPLDMKVMSSVLFTSLALGIALYGITKALAAITWKGAMIAMLGKGAILTILIGAVAGGVVLASWLFSKISPISLMQGVTAIFVAVTLGIVMFLMSKVIKETKGMTPESALATGLVMLSIATIIPIASKLLSDMKTWTFGYALKVLVTSLSIGISILAFTPAIFILKKANLKWEDIAKIGVMMLGISAIIVATSWILDFGKYDGNVPPYEWSLKVGLSLVVFGTEVATLGWVVSKIEEQNLAYGAVAAVVVSLVIMASSWILSKGNYSTYPSLEWSAGVGLSILVFGGSMVALGFLFDATGGIGIEMLALGALGALMIAATIMVSSYILGAGSYGTYPNLDWSAGVGLSMLTFGISTVALGLFIAATFGGGLLVLALGAAGTFIVADTIVKVSRILSTGTYSKGPPLDWAMGTGLLMTAFTVATMGLGVLAMTGLGFLAIKAGAYMMKYIAQSIVDVSKILGRGTYTGGPTYEWANGVGTAIMAFAEAIASMGIATGGLKSLLFGIDVEQMKQSISAVVDGMVEANKKLGGVSWSGNYPSEQWALGVGTAVSKFAEAARSLYGGVFSTDITNSFVHMVDILMSGIVYAALRMQSATGVKWDSLPYPNPDWVSNVSTSIQSFIDLVRAFRGNWFQKNLSDVFIPTLDSIITGLIHIGVRFSTSPATLIKWNSLPYPNPDWITNICDSINSIVTLSKKDFDVSDSQNLDRMVDSMISMVQKVGLLNGSDPIYSLSRALKDLGKTLNDLDMSVFDKLTKFSSTFTTISLIDNLKLQQTIDTINSRKLDIKAVIDDSSSRFDTIGGGYQPNSFTTINSPFLETEKITNPLLDLVAYNKNIDKNIQELLKISKEGSESPKNVTVSKATTFGYRPS